MKVLKEVFIEVRDSGISIQAVGIGKNKSEARKLLQSALESLDSDREKQMFGNEIVVKNRLKTN